MSEQETAVVLRATCTTFSIPPFFCPAKYTDGTPYEDWFNTVIFAIGRDAETKGLNLEAAGVEVNPKNGKVGE